MTQFSKRQLVVFAALLLFSLPMSSQVKFPSPEELKKARNTVRDATNTLREARRFIQEAKRTTKDFNELVTVVKGESSGTKTAKKAKSIKIVNGELSGANWEPVVFFDNEIFPSAIVSLASYRGDFTNELLVISRPVGFKILSDKQNVSLKWEIECTNKDFFDKVSGVVIYEKAGREVFVMPEIPWNFNSLINQVGSVPFQLIYRFFDKKGNKVEKVVRVNMRSITDCIFQYRDTRMHYLFSAYIQESHPEIDNILRAALDTKMITSIQGYQGGELAVLLQVAAVWRVLHDKGFQYSSITTPSVSSQSSYFCQSVRTFGSAYQTSQANCVDGTVVLASILRKMGIAVEMIIVPGHCFLGFYGDESCSEENRYFLETTMLGFPLNINSSQSEEEISLEYFDHFSSALKQGQATYERYKGSPNLIVINIGSARKLINPIPILD